MTSTDSPSSARSRLFIWLLLLILTAGIYARCVRYGFVKYDDDALFSDRAIPRSVFGSEGARVWTSSAFGNWQPIVTLTLVIDRRLHGLNPHWLHAEDALLHALCGIAVFEFLREATSREAPSAWVAVLFVCAPMHVESVAWLSERKDEMASLFFFLSLSAYSRYARSGGWTAYVSAIALAALSLMCKPMAASLPAVMLLLDFWPLGRLDDSKRQWSRVLLEKVPFVLLAAASAAIAVVTQRAWGRVAGLATPLPILARIDNAIVCYFVYVWKLIVPVNLAVFYPHPGDRPVTQVLAAAAVLAAITAWAAASARRRPQRIIGWLWFLGTLVPVIGLFQIGAQAMADRYSYIPSVGLFMIGVWGVDELLGPRRAAAVGSVLIAVYSVLAFVQVGYWSDTETLFTHAADVTTDNWEADTALGDIAFDRGDHATAAGYYAEVIRIAPGSPKGYERLARCVAESDPARAATLLRRAVDRSPLSVSYRLRLARALLEVGDLRSALDEARAALSLDPGSGDARAAVTDLSRRTSQ